MTLTATNVLPAIPGGWTERDFVLGGRTFRVTLPASPDAFLDDPEVLAANRRDDYMPYWSYLWPASLETAVAVLKHDWLKTGTGSDPLSPPLSKGGQGGTREDVQSQTFAEDSVRHPFFPVQSAVDFAPNFPPLRKGGQGG